MPLPLDFCSISRQPFQFMLFLKLMENSPVSRMSVPAQYLSHKCNITWELHSIISRKTLPNQWEEKTSVIQDIQHTTLRNAWLINATYLKASFYLPLTLPWYIIYWKLLTDQWSGAGQYLANTCRTHLSIDDPWLLLSLCCVQSVVVHRGHIFC